MQQRLPISVIRSLATKESRLHHFLWHNIRNIWNSLSPKDQQEIEKLGWKPPRPSLEADRITPIKNNRSGEDFLYMHRLMIEFVNDQLRLANDQNYKNTEGWKDIPGPDDANFPVPADDGSGSDKTVKSPEFFRSDIAPRNTKFKDPAYLRTVSLGELGAEIEFTVHNYMHMRWSAPVREVRPRMTVDQLRIDDKWDSPSYDYLGDTYSSHVNPLFWKIHGWVDARIEDWKKANNIVNIPWPTDWSLNQMSFHIPSDLPHTAIIGESINFLHHPHQQHNMSAMYQVLAILAKTGKCKEYFSDMQLPPPALPTPKPIAESIFITKLNSPLRKRLLADASIRMAIQAFNALPDNPNVRSRIRLWDSQVWEDAISNYEQGNCKEAWKDFFHLIASPDTDQGMVLTNCGLCCYRIGHYQAAAVFARESLMHREIPEAQWLCTNAEAQLSKMYEERSSICEPPNCALI